MDFGRIKNLVKQNGDKFVFVENGEPEIVMMSFGEYQKLARHNANDANRYANTANDHNEYSNHSSEDSRNSSRLGSHSSGKLESPESPIGGLPVRLEDIRLEDLPI